MVENLSPQQIYTFIVKDFEGAWDTIANNGDQTIGRGNFMFARQAMSLLEFVARFYGNDTNLHKKDSEDLYKIEPKYFTALPGPVASTSGFVLPHLGNTSILLWSLFDLIRNGIAHQYQQIRATLTYDKHFYITLDGATYHRDLSIVAASRSRNYLCYDINTNGDLGLLVDPGRLFLDFKDATENSHLLENASSFQYLSRTNYNFDVRSLGNSLILSNHLKCR